VTDDEAFLRAIVDAPGDDAPRLVYADWLDERGDPRGAYLREEAAWAAPWRAGSRPTRDAGLLDLAIDLDPIWVARVSRPPMGACLHHLRLVHPGPALNRQDILAFERQHSVTLPDAFAALLLNRNGGRSSRRRVASLFRRRIGSFRMLAPAGWSPASGADSYPLLLAGVLSDTSPALGQVIEFADDRATGGYFIGVKPGMMGVIYHAKDRGSFWEDGGGNYGIAPSLPELLAAVG